MTIEELQQVKFHLVSSIAMANEHCMTYANDDGRLGFCDHTSKKKNGDFCKTRRHYRIDGKVYKTKDAFEEAIKNFNPKEESNETNKL